MAKIKTLKKCQDCKNHVSDGDDYIVCKYFGNLESRDIGKTDEGVLYIPQCPKKTGRNTKGS